jgi:hypothetical protein
MDRLNTRPKILSTNGSSCCDVLQNVFRIANRCRGVLHNMILRLQNHFSAWEVCDLHFDQTIMKHVHLFAMKQPAVRIRDNDRNIHTSQQTYIVVIYVKVKLLPKQAVEACKVVRC